MAIIQIKRRTSSGTGPLTGTSGSVKAGEPLIDLNGGNLYISKADKTASSGNPLALADYIEYLSKPNADSMVNTKIDALSLGTASKKNTGTTNGTVPLIGADGKLPTAIIPNISPVLSVNNKTGAVTITLSELGGVSTTTYNSHVSSNLHLTQEQINKLSTIFNTTVSAHAGAKYIVDKPTFNSSVLSDALVMHYEVMTQYTPAKHVYSLGIDKTKVLTPTSIIDGGTY